MIATGARSCAWHWLRDHVLTWQSMLWFRRVWVRMPSVTVKPSWHVQMFCSTGCFSQVPPILCSFHHFRRHYRYCIHTYKAVSWGAVASVPYPPVKDSLGNRIETGGLGTDCCAYSGLSLDGTSRNWENDAVKLCTVRFVQAGNRRPAALSFCLWYKRRPYLSPIIVATRDSFHIVRDCCSCFWGLISNVSCCL